MKRHFFIPSNEFSLEINLMASGGWFQFGAKHHINGSNMIAVSHSWAQCGAALLLPTPAPVLLAWPGPVSLVKLRQSQQHGRWCQDPDLCCTLTLLISDDAGASPHWGTRGQDRMTSQWSRAAPASQHPSLLTAAVSCTLGSPWRQLSTITNNL